MLIVTKLQKCYRAAAGCRRRANLRQSIFVYHHHHHKRRDYRSV